MNAWLLLFCFATAVLAYVQFVYPMVCILAALVPTRRRATISDWPCVSLIIPAFNEESVLLTKLRNALAIDYPSDRVEVLVASDGSTDGTNDIARTFTAQGVRLLDFGQRRGKASVVNDAVGASVGEIICLCDANVMFRPDALKLLVGQLADARIGASTGDVRLASGDSSFGAGERLYYRIERSMQVGESELGSLMGVDGGMYVVRKSLYKLLPPDTILDDFVIAMQVLRQGYRVVYEPKAIATENGTPLARQEFRRRVRITAGAAQSFLRGAWPSWRRPVECWQYVSHKAARWLTPVWLIAIGVASVSLARDYQEFRALLAGELLAVCVGVLAAVVPASRRIWPVAVIFYFAMSQVAMLLGFWKGLCGQQGVAWTPTARGGATPRAQPLA